MIFSLAIKMKNNDIHTMNIKAQSFDHASKKVDQYCYIYNKHLVDIDCKKYQLSCDDSRFFCLDYPLVTISPKKIGGFAVITHNENDTLYIL